MQPTKLFITPNELRLDSVRLAMKAIKDGWIPTHMVALWRGGAPIGCFMHEAFAFHGHTVDHIAIRTTRTTGIDKFAPAVEVHNLTYLTERLAPTDRVLIVDDVFESGRSIAAVVTKLQEQLRFNMPRDVRVATLYVKPSKRETLHAPDYVVHQTEQWVVFPHELDELEHSEIDPEVLAILKST